MNTYHAVVTRDGKFWLIHITDIDKYTQARNLPEVEVMARDLISIYRDVPPDSFPIDFRIELPGRVEQHLERARKYANEAAHAQAEAASERRAAARELQDQGLTVRDIGAALGVSHQRAQQLVSA